MQQYLTLDEAAQMLHIAPDELREMAKKKTVRAFQDRGTWRFRVQDIEELERGQGSDPEVRLSDSSKKIPAPKKSKLDDLTFDDDEVPLGKEKPSHGPRSGRTKSPPPTKAGSDSDVRLILDDDLGLDIDSDVKVESGGPKSMPKMPRKSVLQTGGRKSKLEPADSGVRLVGADDPSDSDVKVIPSSKESGVNKKPKSASDSDIRLDDLPSASGRRKGPEANIITEEIDLDAEEARLAERNQNKPKPRSKARPQTMVANSLLPTESPFEISEPDMDLNKSGKIPKKKKSEVDSSSDFELIPFDASKSPVDLGSGEIPILTGDEEVNLGSEVAGGRSGNSGINLQDPIDSGISLESGGSDEIAFDLSEEEGMTPRPKPAVSKLAAPKITDDSSSEFELSLDDSDGPDDSDASGSSEFELSIEDSDESSLTIDDPDASSSSEFELSLDASDESLEMSGVQPNSDSEFELSLDDEGGLSGEEDAKDIFEETNFDVPALEDDSGSEAVAIDDVDTDLEGSDFEISLDDDSSTGEESGSEVVSLDEDEEADEGAATVARARKPTKPGKFTAPIDDEEEADVDAPTAKAGKKKPKKAPVADEDDLDVDVNADVEDDADSDADVERPARVAAAPADWGLPTVLLFPTVIVLFVVGLMGFELVRGMWGYHRPSTVGRPIIDTIARQLDDTLPK